MMLHKPKPRALDHVELHDSELGGGPTHHGKHQGLDRVLFIGAEFGPDGVEQERASIMGDDPRFDQAGSRSFFPFGGQGDLTLDFVSQFNAVLLWGDGFDRTVDTNISNILKDYVDHGGGVVVSTFWGHFQDPGFGGEFDIKDGINSHGYNALVNGTDTSYDFRTIGAFNDPASPLLDGVKSITSVEYSGDYLGVDPGAHLVATWSDGRPLAAVNAAGNVANVTIFPGGVTQFFGTPTTGDGARLLLNALDFVAGDPTGIK